MELSIRAYRLAIHEVHYCVSNMVKELLRDQKYASDLVRVSHGTVYQCSQCGYSSRHKEDLDECCCEARNKETKQSEVCREAQEYWIVSDWLGERLKERNEMVINFKGLVIWGRCASSKSIALDSVIQDIAKGFE